METLTVAAMDECIGQSSDRQVVARLEERKEPFSRMAEEQRNLGNDA